MLSKWQEFVASVRGSVAGSRIVAELLAAILDGDRYLVRKILQESLYDPKLESLIRQVEVDGATLRGRIEVRRVLDEHLFISSLPTDDVSLRRVYIRWRCSSSIGLRRAAGK